VLVGDCTHPEEISGVWAQDGTDLHLQRLIGHGNSPKACRNLGDRFTTVHQVCTLPVDLTSIPGGGTLSSHDGIQPGAQREYDQHIQ